MRSIIPSFLLSMFLLSSCGVAVEGDESVAPDMISQIQQCSKLELTQYKIHVITKYQDDGSELKGNILGFDYNLRLPTGTRKIAIPIEATVHSYIDLSDFSEDNVTYVDDKVILTLPDPKIELLNTRVKNDEISTGVSFFRSKFTDEEITRIQRMGRDSIENDVRKMGFTERAKKQAAAVLIPIVRQLGFTDDQIVVEFNKGLNDNTLQFIYTMEE